MDFDWITPGMAVGSRLMPGTERELVPAGIEAVVDCRDEERDDEEVLRALGIAFLHLPAPDHEGLAQPQLSKGVEWVLSRQAAGAPTLIHCQHGIGRSALLCCCVLVAQGAEPLEALRTARRGRPLISPGVSQMQAYRRWLEAWRARHRVGWKVPSLEELKEIAWGPVPAARVDL